MKKRFYIIVLSLLPAGIAAGQEGDSLHHYTAVALRDNPTVKAARHAHEAATRAAARAGALEDPVLEAGLFLDPMPLVEGRQVAQFQLMQMFPWFGTRRAAREEMTRMAGMALEQYRESADNLREEVAARWHALCLLRQRWLVNEEERSLLEQLERLALQRFSTSGGGDGAYTPAARGESPPATPAATGMAGMKTGGTTGGGMTGGAAPAASMSSMSSMSPATGAGLAAVLRLRLERVAAESEAGGILSELVAGKAAFNALLDRPAGSEVVLPDTCRLVVLAAGADSVALLVAARNPMLGMIREEALAHGARAEMSRKMGYPMLGAGVQYMLVEKAPAGDGTGMKMGGMDMVMPMVSVSIPLFRGKYRAAREESELRQRASEERYRATSRQLEAELYRYRHELAEATRKLALAREQAAIARATYDLGLREFASGRGSLDDLLQVRRQLLEYRLAGVTAIATYNTAAAAVQRLVSRPRPDSF
jgi:outer membrane protein TolC